MEHVYFKSLAGSFCTNLPLRPRSVQKRPRSRDAGTGGQDGQLPPLPFTRRGKWGKVPFQFKGLPWRNSELSEMLVPFLYEFASENARNAVIELQE